MNEEVGIILDEIQTVFSTMNGKQVGQLVDTLGSANRIFVLGEGRSGLMAKSFAMRLMHLGFNVYVVGETITPSIQKGDLLVAISGSGTTTNVVQAAEKARKNGISVVSVTSDPSSRLAETSDSVIHIPSATKYRRPGEIESRQPLSSLFDQAVHLFFDAACLRIAEHQESGNDAAFVRHSNLE
ncbi:6-phospho-3-hexuloisomerase [Heyndrickxia acidiproducens]|uniref:6-phospho-3-hexuloisomerase n=1 Tax=Heyndrickxia acidiproducens TaxID=1121084 RepID=UPI000361B8B0|nr:6-phospho-3-hexuloisomerase [Heyndrickxia acidiproducens]